MPREGQAGEQQESTISLLFQLHRNVQVAMPASSASVPGSADIAVSSARL